MAPSARHRARTADHAALIQIRTIFTERFHKGLCADEVAKAELGAELGQERVIVGARIGAGALAISAHFDHATRYWAVLDYDLSEWTAGSAKDLGIHTADVGEGEFAEGPAKAVIPVRTALRSHSESSGR